MKINALKRLVQSIVIEAHKLSAAHTSEKRAPVNYACIFTQSANEYEEMVKLARQLGPVVQETTMGPVLHISPISTVAGRLRLLKIRRPDPKRPERGDADFTVADYAKFKQTYLGKPGFGILTRPGMEMLELTNPSYNVVAYFSHPILAKVLGIQDGNE